MASADEISLGLTKISDEGFRRLAEVSNLKVLEAKRTSVMDQAVDKLGRKWLGVEVAWEIA